MSPKQKVMVVAKGQEGFTKKRYEGMKYKNKTKQNEQTQKWPGKKLQGCQSSEKLLLEAICWHQRALSWVQNLEFIP